MKIVFRRSFLKMRDKLDKTIQSKLSERLLIFEGDPFSHILHNHPLLGEYEGYRSISITGDYRAIFREYPDRSYEFVEFISIGTHSQLYG